ncbi:FAD/NAD(P)-binding domain-containing protein [Aspergillus ellipticus CBS 707.79]|uniref:FAD/NAD(P)-binding domain-containing protein n=1 Tax=Aspergillus ellipticus CBS 707.79 TaxID=1448320 RepID=A0A319DXS5_9EURO|nr:FAD/NAD(P)-binding domain-containing protein [Aspergillus ellipticus CBS 707.79]
MRLCWEKQSRDANQSAAAQPNWTTPAPSAPKQHQQHHQHNPHHHHPKSHPPHTLIPILIPLSIMTTPIRIAISGGGLAGACLLHALLPHKHLDVHIFESASSFKESGMAVGIARNALSALDLIGPSTAQCLSRAGAVPMRGVRFMLAQGPDAESLISETHENDDITDNEKRVTSIVHRAAFLHELLSGVDPERMHASKKLERYVENPDGSLVLYFADGTIHECDILIGADGIRSTVRRLILGEEDPAAKPRSTGAWCVMTLMPYTEVQKCLGKGFVDVEDAREYMWVGDGSYLIHNVLQQGELVQVVVATHEKEGEVKADRWNRMVGVEEIRGLFKGWPQRLYEAVDQLLCTKDEQPAMYLWEHPPASTYVSGPVCIMGDAAHATSPWQGSGGGMSVEDSMILSTLLGRAETVTQARTALQVYDRVRRPRTQRIVESSRGTGRIACGLGEETGLDLGKLRGKLLPRWDFIVDFDNEKHRDEAVEMFEREVKGET